ncbi:hypothetical protein C8Q77DRAFT_1272744, partial [Trametes polyzona]
MSGDRRLPFAGAEGRWREAIRPLGGVESRAHLWVIGKPSPPPLSAPPRSFIDARDGRVPRPVPSALRGAESRGGHDNAAYRLLVIEDAHR